MSRDIDTVIAAVRRTYPGVAVEQLRVTHPADDDGIWFFSHTRGRTEVQVESSNGAAPFLIETNDDPPLKGQSVDEAIAIIPQLLGVARDPT